MSFFEEVHSRYLDISFPETYHELIKIDTMFWYLADKLDGIVAVFNNEIIELDISAAFPTICKNIFGENSKFVKELYSISDKIKRNIYISTNLKDTGYIDQLNTISKMIITGCVFEQYPSAEILELKKDGIIFTKPDSEYRSETGKSHSDESNNRRFTTYIKEKGFSIHRETYSGYVRNARTSIFIGDKVTYKGTYKYLPPYLKDINTKLLFGEEIDKKELLKYYSEKYWKIIVENSLDELLRKYYICENDKFLNSSYKYEPITSITKIRDLIIPRNYLKLFVFPILSVI